MQLGSSPTERLYSPILPPAPYILALCLLPPLFCSPILVPSLYFLTRHLRLTKLVPHTGKQQERHIRKTCILLFEKILTFSYFWRKKKYKFLVFFRGDFL